jgi:mannose-6-phosphate isomerase
VNAPLRFESYLRPMVWGGRQLGDALGKVLPDNAAYGEAWEISDHASHASVVVNGPYKGQTLRQLMERQADLLLGAAADRHARFPWLVKLLDACDWLSVQVHPNDDKAARLWPGEGGKTEAWFVLAAAPNSRIYAGLLPGVEERQLRHALRQGTVAECLHSFTPRPGDCVFLPAGTVHAVGGGVLMAEVQQTSDATFRLFDWNRRDARGQMRQLHVEEALACIDWSSGPVSPVRARGYLDPARRATRRVLVKCPYFTLEYLHQREPFRCGGSGAVQVMLVLRGRARLETSEGTWSIGRGDTLLLPAALDALICQPEGAVDLLLSTYPFATCLPVSSTFAR